MRSSPSCQKKALSDPNGGATARSFSRRKLLNERLPAFGQLFRQSVVERSETLVERNETFGEGGKTSRKAVKRSRDSAKVLRNSAKVLGDSAKVLRDSTKRSWNRAKNLVVGVKTRLTD